MLPASLRICINGSRTFSARQYSGPAFPLFLPRFLPRKATKEGGAQELVVDQVVFLVGGRTGPYGVRRTVQVVQLPWPGTSQAKKSGGERGTKECDGYWRTACLRPSVVYPLPAQPAAYDEGLLCAFWLRFRGHSPRRVRVAENEPTSKTLLLSCFASVDS